MTDDASGGFQVGRVITDGLRAAWRTFPVLWLVIGLCVVLPEALLELVLPDPANGGGAGGGGVAGGILGVLASGATIYACFNQLAGTPVTMRQAFDRGAQRFLPLWGLGILSGLGIALGLILLVVPGIILAVMWSVATPVRVMEPVTVTEALGRSRSLTKGYRWPIFGTYLIIGAAALVLFSIVVALGAGFITLNQPIYLAIMQVVISPLMAGVLVWLSGGITAAVYWELLRLKEGGGAAVADVFS